MTIQQTTQTKRGPVARNILIIVILAVGVGVCVAAAVLATMQAGRIGALTASNRTLSGQVASLDHQLGQVRQSTDALSQAQRERQSATLANLGECVSSYTQTFSDGTSLTYINNISSPALTAGVASCPTGSFVPASPQKTGG